MSPSPKRGRPPLSSAEVAAQRARILAAAAALFEQEGYAAISMRRLAVAAGLTPMTLYAYFDGKPAILAALWTSLMAEALAALDEVEAAEPKGRLLALCRAYVGHWIARPETYRVVFMTPGISQADVSGFLAGSDIASRLEVFGLALAAVAPGWSAQVLKLRTDALLCGLQGIAHNHVTIAGFGWSNPEALVGVTVDGVLAA